ncbi:MAG: ribonuclease HII [Gammaproteobacteria bacterium]
MTRGRQSGLPMFSGSRWAGVDEAGRGPLAGPVMAAAVVLDPHAVPAGLADSKKLSAGRRSELASAIRSDAIAWAVAWADAAEIDALNILRASMLAMRRAVLGLFTRPEHAQVDGTTCPRLPCTVEAIVRGDSSVAAISAASILAKVARDEFMHSLDRVYPDYGFYRHKGYPTAAHLAALAKLGPCACHRRSFRPVRESLRGAVA